MISAKESIFTPIRKVAVILAGCGAKDGSEITEAVSLIVTLQQVGFSLEIFAPDRPFYHVVNHFTDEVTKQESRNILIESARIAKGNIKAISSLKAENFHALAFSGGFGVAKNLCDFAFAAEKATLESDIRPLLFDFIHSKKPIGALCISPILLALAARDLGITGAELTFGLNSDPMATLITKWGLKHKECAVHEACIDTQNLFVTAPAYMHSDASFADVYSSAQALAEGLKNLLV